MFVDMMEISVAANITPFVETIVLTDSARICGRATLVDLCITLAMVNALIIPHPAIISAVQDIGYVTPEINVSCLV